MVDAAGPPAGRRADPGRGGRRRSGPKIERGAGRARWCSTPSAASSRPAWSTCTPICASRAARRPRRSRPGPGPRPSAATPPSWPCPTPSRPIDCAAVVREVLDLGAGACCDVRRGRGHHRRAGQGTPAGPDGRDGRPRGADLHRRRRPACRTPGSCGGPSSTPRGSASPWPSTARTPRWPAAATCTRGSGRAASASPASPAEAEELMVMRDLALARLTGAPHPLPAPVDAPGRWPWSGRPRRRGWR